MAPVCTPSCSGYVHQPPAPRLRACGVGAGDGTEGEIIQFSGDQSSSPAPGARWKVPQPSLALFDYPRREHKTTPDRVSIDLKCLQYQHGDLEGMAASWQAASSRAAPLRTGGRGQR